MASLTRQALVVSAARLINQGLMVVSPLLLVRLLSVEDFGLYREFLLYSTVVGSLAVFSLPNSLLYFVGREPNAAWVFVSRIAASVAATSVIAVTAFAALSWMLPEPLIEGQLTLCVIYVLLYTNLDFWEFLWFAQRRPVAVFVYSSGRLAARLAVVVTSAWLTRDIEVILWSLVVLEGVRLAGALVAWRRKSATEAGEAPRAGWREMFEYCVPSGLSVFLSTFSSSLSGMFIDQSLGTAALAQFVIGGYVFLTVFPLRNAISDVLLPEMALRGDRAANGWLPVWKRSVIVVAMFLVPAAVLLAWYSEDFIGIVFSDKYLAAKPVFLAYCVLIALSCFDLAVVFRAINKTRAMLAATFVTISVNLGGLVLLVPTYGLKGAAIALVSGNFVALCYAVWKVSGLIGVTVTEMLPFASLLRVCVAACSAAGALVAAGWGAGRSGVLEIAAASLVFFLIYVVGLRLLRLDEAAWVMQAVKRRLA